MAFLILDRESRRPDFAPRGLYFETGLGALSGIAATFPALGVLVTPLFLARSATFVTVAGLTLLRPRRDKPGRNLWMAAVTVPVVALVTDRIVGIPFVIEDRGFSVHHRIFLILGVTALWVAPKLDPPTVVRLAKIVLGAYLITSLVAFAVGAAGASAPYGAWSLLPGIDVRVSGIFRHANNLGPATLLYLLLERIRPSRWIFQVGMGTAALALLVLSQSKTSWVIAVALALILFSARWEASRALAVTGFVVAVAVPVLLIVGFQPGDLLEHTPVREAETLTGRTELWEHGLEEWRESPIIGRGTGVYLDIASEMGRDWAASGHNEYLQALAENGMVGLLSVLVYVVVLIRVGLRHAVVTRNASLALVALLLFQTLTETHLIAFDLEHMTVLALLLGLEREARGPTMLEARRDQVDERVRPIPARHATG